MRKILIVDDDENLAWAVQRKFENLGFEVQVAATGREGVSLMERETPDLLLLDLNLPDVDGLDVCRYLRRRSDVPIIMLTGRAEESDTIVGLEVGADDYVSKPFSLNELAARVRAVLRRKGLGLGALAPPPPAPGAAPDATSQRLAAAGLEMDLAAKRVWVDEEEVSLTPTEFKLLQTLLHNLGRVVSHQQLLEAAWDSESDDTHLVEVHIGNLRSKVDKGPRRRKRIKTVRGFGYRIDADEA